MIAVDWDDPLLNTYEQADQLLDVLDKAPVGTSGTLFTDNLAKQWMESCIIRAVKKLQGRKRAISDSTLLLTLAKRAAEGHSSTQGDGRDGIVVWVVVGGVHE